MTDDATRRPTANHEPSPRADERWPDAADDDLADAPWLDGGAVADDDDDSDDDSEPVTGRTLGDARDALDVLMRVVGPERDGPPALWFLVLDAADQVLPLVLPIAEVRPVPDAVVAANLVHVLASVLEHDAPGGSVVVGYVRRGGGDLGAFEAGWSAALHVGAGRESVRIRAEAAIGRDRARILSASW